MTEAAPLTPAPQLEKTQHVLEVVQDAKNYHQQDESSWDCFERLSGEQYDDILRCVVNDEKLLASVKDNIRICCYGKDKNVYIYKRSLLHRLFAKKIGKEITNKLQKEKAKEGPAASFAGKIKNSETAIVKYEGMYNLYQPDLSFWHEEADGPCVILAISAGPIYEVGPPKRLGIVEACLEGNKSKLRVGINIDIQQNVSGKPYDAELAVFKSEWNGDSKTVEVYNAEFNSILSKHCTGIHLKLSDFSHGKFAQEIFDTEEDHEIHFSEDELRDWFEEANREAEKMAEAGPTS